MESNHQIDCKYDTSVINDKKSELQKITDIIYNQKLDELKNLNVIYEDYVKELFFLQNGGNLMDFVSWKKRPNKLLSCYLSSKKIDVEETENMSSTLLSDYLYEEGDNGFTKYNDERVLMNSVRSEASLCDNMFDSLDAFDTQDSFTIPDNESSNDSGQVSIVQDSVAELAKQEASVMKKITELRSRGLWSMRRIPKSYEPTNAKVHWDYVLEEMQWLATDFAQERKLKRSAAKKVSRLVTKFFQDIQQKDMKAEKEDTLKLKRIAYNISKNVKEFWSNIEKVVLYKQQSRVDEKRKKALDQHLNFIVDQTEKYSTWLSEGLLNSSQSSQDLEIQTQLFTEEFGKETNETNNDREDVADKMTNEFSTDKLLHSPVNDSDAESYQPSDDDDDEEETINEQEKMENDDHYDDELSCLEKEGNLPIEELYKMYYENVPSMELQKGESRSKKDVSSLNKKLNPCIIKKEDGEKDVNKEKITIRNSSLIECRSIEQPDVDQHMNGVNGNSSDSIADSLVSTTNNRKAHNLEEDISNITAQAMSLQPTGYTLETAHVKTPVPFLLKHTLREYQHVGLDWLATMYDQKLNGILADEMGLGKTIQTIALLGFLAIEKSIWGPHLIVVPTSVMLNWEMEFKKWCPGFKILTYYGSLKERKLKRQGWTKTNAFHVCITSYKLVIQDHQAFRRKKWKYFILDEAHNIKNFKSQRWQTLLNFHSQRRLLLTGTPLQNNLMELWSLMHFLMPHVFQSHGEFKEWFSNPLTGMIEGSKEYNDNLIRRLHKVLRPFLLRRLKQDVEKQMPKKYEHVIICRLAKHQRYLYDDFMSQAKTKETLATGHFMSVINILMQLRKVCNHPNLFDPRPIVSPFHMEGMTYLVPNLIIKTPFKKHVPRNMFPSLASLEIQMSKCECQCVSCSYTHINEFISGFSQEKFNLLQESIKNTSVDPVQLSREEYLIQLKMKSVIRQKNKLEKLFAWNKERCSHNTLYGCDVRRLLTINNFYCYHSNEQMKPNKTIEMLLASKHQQHIDDKLHSTTMSWSCQGYLNCSHAQLNGTISNIEGSHYLQDVIQNFMRRLTSMNEVLMRFVFVIPAVTSPKIIMFPYPRHHHQQLLSYTPPILNNPSSLFSPSPPLSSLSSLSLVNHLKQYSFVVHQISIKRTVQFPELRLIQYDSGKLQSLDKLLRELKYGGHRVLIFTQMTKMLDVLEQFLNFHGHRYLRLDGTTKVEQRQALMERFNMDPKIFCFILSTRSGGIGVNLTGADTVIFYDSDWNPTMDAQAQDRCHRIGQTRDVHIYRLVCEKTIEENILKKANEKRLLGNVAIEGGNFTTAFFKQQTIKDLFEEPSGLENMSSSQMTMSTTSQTSLGQQLSAASSCSSLNEIKPTDQSSGELTQEQIEQALCAAEDETDIQAAECAKAEQKEELAEFDENLPWEDAKYNETPCNVNSEKICRLEDVSSLEIELDQLNKKLIPIERYAVSFMEHQMGPKDNEDDEDDVNMSLEKWELDHLKALKEEEERKAENEEDEMLFVSNMQHPNKDRKIKFNKSTKIPYLEMKKMHFLARKQEKIPSEEEEEEDVSVGDVEDNNATDYFKKDYKTKNSIREKIPFQFKKCWKKLPMAKYGKLNKKSKTSNFRQLDSNNKVDADADYGIVHEIDGSDHAKKGKRHCLITPSTSQQHLPIKQMKLDIREDMLKHISKIKSPANHKVEINISPSTIHSVGPETNQTLNAGLLLNKQFILPNNQRILVHRFTRPNMQPQTIINHKIIRPTISSSNKIIENKPTPILEKLQSNVPSKTLLTTLTQPMYLKTSNVVPKSTNQLVARSVFMPSSSSNGVLQFFIDKNSVSAPKTVQTSTAANYYVLKNPSVPGQNFLIPTSTTKSTNVILVPNTQKPSTNVNQGFILLSNHSNNNACNIQRPSGSGGIILTPQASKSMNVIFQNQSPVKQISFAPSNVLQNFQLKTNVNNNIATTSSSNTVPILEKLAMQLDKQNKISPPFTVKLSKLNSCLLQQPLTTNAIPKQHVFLKTPDGSIIQSKLIANNNARLLLNPNLLLNTANNTGNNNNQSGTHQILLIDNSLTNNFSKNSNT